MQFDIITAFPNAFSYLNESIIKRGKEKGLIKINLVDLRGFGLSERKTIDDRPYGGGAGMVIMVEPVYKALKHIGVYPKKDPRTRIILTSAAGEVWTQKKAESVKSSYDRVVILCGHYEGFDHRIEKYLIDEKISIGSYVLSGGELPAMVILDSVSRLIDGVLGNSESVVEESHSDEFSLEYPQYTRPSTFLTDEGENWETPEILLNGNHGEIKKWRSGNSN